MSLWICIPCTTAYSVGAPECPQCGATDYVEQGKEPMPKITVHGGATNAATDEPDVSAAPLGVDVDPAAEGDGGNAVALDYEAWTVDQLKEALKDRGLLATGKKDDLVLRLLEADDAVKEAG